MEKTKSGNKQAFEELVRRYRDPVYFTIMHITKDPQDIDDIFQEIFLAAFRSINRYDPNRVRFRTWLFSIVKDRIDSYRRPKVQLILMEEFLNEMNVSRRQGIGDSFAAAGTEQALQSAILSFSEEQRLCITLKIIGGLSYEEIAKIASIPVETVKSRISSARKNLTKRILYPLGRDASCSVIK
ncbi:MAG TPA: sigma-70 family RNA polymerase sigma factor [Anaerolineae bacterium]|nr:sigma-70 family RNA polymerase sigma factor [Anaerolineae bacterium]